MTISQYIGVVLGVAVLGFSFWQFAFGGGKKENGHGIGSYW